MSAAETPNTPDVIEFFFDPGCPWTWATSRWLLEAAGARGIAVAYRNLSLAVLNEGREIPDHLRVRLVAGVAAHRVIAGLLADGRNDLVGELYAELGRRLHHDDEAPTVELVRDAARDSGAGSWAHLVDDTSWDAPVLESTRLAMSLAGPDVGSPILAFGEPRKGIFGPIVSPPPTGPEAQRLLDVVLLVAQCPGFYELKRGRSGPVVQGPRP
ncbi:MAG: DsbA family protein [Actinomycetota bacterium]|nr:DsbA family protein [Actinomycetota bacterium]